MAITPQLIDQLLQDHQPGDDLLGQDGLLQQLTKAIVERALQGELTHHLGYEKHATKGKNSGNSRNGTSPIAFAFSIEFRSFGTNSERRQRAAAGHFRPRPRLGSWHLLDNAGAPGS